MNCLCGWWKSWIALCALMSEIRYDAEEGWEGGRKKGFHLNSMRGQQQPREAGGARLH